MVIRYNGLNTLGSLRVTQMGDEAIFILFPVNRICKILYLFLYLSEK